MRKNLLFIDINLVVSVPNFKSCTGLQLQFVKGCGSGSRSEFFYFWIADSDLDPAPDPDPTKVNGWRVIIML